MGKAPEQNHKLVEVTIDKKNVNDPKNWGSNGGKLWNCGIEVNGEWHNTTFWSEKALEKFKEIPEGEPVTLLFYQEEYKDKWHNRFRIPTSEDHKDVKIVQLENWVKAAIDKYPDLKELTIEA